jgi:hypothetical protein
MTSLGMVQLADLHTKDLLDVLGGDDLGTEHSTELGKQTYGGCRRWLPMDHVFRRDEMKDHFNGQVEKKGVPQRVSIEDQLRYNRKYATWKVIGHREDSPGDPSKKHGVKRNCILNTLPYWKVHFSGSRFMIHVCSIVMH